MNIISREQALQEGRARYFTGRPCKRGHLSERYVSNSACVACVAEKSSLIQARKANGVPTPISRDDARAQGKRWYFTGEPCSNGHVSERSVQTGHCRACDQAARTGLVDTVITVPQRDLALIKQIAKDLCSKV